MSSSCCCWVSSPAAVRSKISAGGKVQQTGNFLPLGLVGDVRGPANVADRGRPSSEGGCDVLWSWKEADLDKTAAPPAASLSESEDTLVVVVLLSGHSKTGLLASGSLRDSHEDDWGALLPSANDAGEFGCLDSWSLGSLGCRALPSLLLLDAEPATAPSRAPMPWPSLGVSGRLAGASSLPSSSSGTFEGVDRPL